MIDSLPDVDRNTWVVLPSSIGEALPERFDKLVIDDYVFARQSDGRFPHDRCMIADDSYVVLLDGVILNKMELLQEHGHDSVHTLLTKLVRARGIAESLAALRGPFSGVVLDRQRQVVHAFGNHTGDTVALAYGHDGPNPMFSNSFDLMIRVLRHIGAIVAFDEHAAQVMLSHGFMIDNHTFAEEIVRVGPGEVLSVDRSRGGSVTDVYWRLRTDLQPGVTTIKEAVDELDRLFRNAVKRCFDKDLEYGYRRHLADLSGGLDARMVNIVARDLGYNDITNVNYSETRSDDYRYSLRMAKRMGNDYLYHPLDGGRVALDPELNLRLNSGLAFYSGITGGTFVLRSLDFNEFGLEHTGQIGDVVIGSFASSGTRRPPPLTAGAFGKANVYPPRLTASDEELFLMYTRAFRGALSSHLTRQHFTFAVSPYVDVDLLDFALSLPPEWRIGHRLFARWIRSRYPWALEVPTTRLLPIQVNPLHHSRLFSKKAIGVLVRNAQDQLNRRHIRSASMLSRLANSMNPLESWYATNLEFRRLIDRSHAEAAGLPVSDEVGRALERSFGPSGTIWDKVLAVTVVHMHHLYFADPSKSP